MLSCVSSQFTGQSLKRQFVVFSLSINPPDRKVSHESTLSFINSFINLSINPPDRKVSHELTLSPNNYCEIFPSLVLTPKKCVPKPEDRSCSAHCCNTENHVRGPLPSTQILSSLLTLHFPKQKWTLSLSYNSCSG